MTSPDYVLSSYEFDILWGELDLGRMPYPLDVPRTGRTMEQRAQLAGEVYRELGDRGLASGKRMDPDLEGLLRLLGGYRVSIDAVGFIGYPLRALVAGNGRTAVLAVLAGGELWLSQIRPTALALGITEVLPDAAPGPGQSMQVPYRAVMEASDPPEDAYGDPMDERDVLAEAGVSRRDAEFLLDLAANRRAGGQFGVSTGDRGDRMPTLVTWFDTDQGRYLMVRDGDWLSIGPADNMRIEQRIAAVLSEVD